MMDVIFGSITIVICLIWIGVMVFDAGYESARKSAAKANAGHWIVNAQTGNRDWKWGPDPNFKEVIRKP